MNIWTSKLTFLDTRNKYVDNIIKNIIPFTIVFKMRKSESVSHSVTHDSLRPHGSAQQALLTEFSR